MMHFIHGNGLHIQQDIGESIHGFDRIYAGAAISLAQLKTIRMLLRPGGVLVAPVEDELLKVVRTRTRGSSLSSSSLRQESSDEINHGFTTQIISGVTFAPLLSKPHMNTVIPATKWSVQNHHLYPESFQKATKTILLCRNSHVYQPTFQQQQPQQNINVSASLPKEVWMHILSFTTRMCKYELTTTQSFHDIYCISCSQIHSLLYSFYNNNNIHNNQISKSGFEPENSAVETEMLQSRLLQEQQKLNRSRRALAASETRNLLLEHQNEMYLQIARHFYESLQDIVREGTYTSTYNQTTSAAAVEAPGSVQLSRESILAAQSLLENHRSILYSRGHHLLELMEDDDDEEEEEDEIEVDEDVEDNDSDEDMAEGMDSDEDSGDRSMMDHVSHTDRSNETNTRQVRTVSISSVDL